MSSSESNIASTLVHTASAMPERPALVFEGTATTYAELLAQASALAGDLRASGLKPGDRVAMILPNVPALPVVYYATLLAGGIIVPMNPLLKSGEIDYFFTDSGASIAFAWPDFIHEAIAGAAGSGTTVVECTATGPVTGALASGAPITEAAPVIDDDTAIILYTSGTTGRPKGAELTHGSVNFSSALCAEQLQKFHPEDVIMGCLPLFHVFGLIVGLTAAVRSGAALAVIPRFDPASALRSIAEDGITMMQGVPTMYSAMLGHPDADTADTSSLRVCISGGAAMPHEVMRDFEQKFGCIILEGYGLSEVPPVASFNTGQRKPGTVGVPVPGCEMKLIDGSGEEVAQGEVGEIVIRGAVVMKGYWRNPEATAAAIPDGWFRTGDMATQDEDGYFTIVDRKKDLIIRGGMNVYPREIEEVIYTHPDVTEVAVVGVPHDELGENVGAAVAVRDGSTTTPEDLIAFVKERVAAYKYPRQIWFVDELPKGPTGKILRREVVPPEA